MEKKYYTYVLLTENNTFYCGYTDDVEKRYEKHISGKGAKYTRANKPVKIIYTAEFETKSEAMKEECRIKDLTRPEKLEFFGMIKKV
jgi:putative endonuclease